MLSQYEVRSVNFWNQNRRDVCDICFAGEKTMSLDRGYQLLVPAKSSYSGHKKPHSIFLLFDLVKVLGMGSYDAHIFKNCAATSEKFVRSLKKIHKFRWNRKGISVQNKTRIKDPDMKQLMEGLFLLLLVLFVCLSSFTTEKLLRSQIIVQIWSYWGKIPDFLIFKQLPPFRCKYTTPTVSQPLSTFEYFMIKATVF